MAGSLLLPGGSMTLPEEPEKMGWTVLRVCAVLPLGEELIFRGGVQRLLRPLGPGVALAGQAVLFAAAHGSAEAKIYAFAIDRKSTRLNSSHIQKSRMPSSA